MLTVNQRYSEIARSYLDPKIDNKSCCGSSCGSETEIPSLGSDKELISYADPHLGEIVLDLGSGPGHDTLEFAERVGPEGEVNGVDFSNDMIELAEKNARSKGIDNVNFHFGNLIDLPVESQTIDLVISNCVLNLVPDKEKALREAFRVLKPGGRIVFSDMVKIGEQELIFDNDSYCACVGGAASEATLKSQLLSVGFEKVQINREFDSVYRSKNGEIPYGSSIFIAYKPVG